MEQLRSANGARKRQMDAKTEKRCTRIQPINKSVRQREEEYAKFMAENPNIFDTEDPNSLVYRLEGEKQEKSGLKPPGSSTNKKKKSNKKKGKK